MKQLFTFLSLALFSLAALPTSAQKVGYVNMQEIISAMPETVQIDTAINIYQRDLYQQYQSMQNELQAESEAFIKDSLTMSDIAKQVKRHSLQDMNLRILQFRQSINRSVSQKYAELMKPVEDKVRAAVEAVAKAGGYGYVFNNLPEGNGLPFLTTKPADNDLTPAVKAKLGIK